MITGTYNLVADPQWRNVQLQDVFLECDTTLAPVTINLFPIADLDRFFNVKISISDVNKNASVNNITINAGSVGLVPVFDTIDEQGNTQIVLNTNGESVVFQPVSDASWIAIESLGGGGASAPVDILYADLYNDTVAAKLTAGQWYRVTDYRSVNFLNGWEIANNNPLPVDPSFDPRQIYTGDVEVILVQAISPYQIAEVGYSETFQGDVIQYQSYTNKIGVDFDISNGTILPDSSIVSGFDLQWDAVNNQAFFNMPLAYPALFGHYFYLYAEFSGGTYYQNGCFEPLTPVEAICQYPYTSDDPAYGNPKAMSRLSVSVDGIKVVLLDLNQNDVNNYDAGTLYVETVYAIGDAFGWITKRNDTLRNIVVPFDFRGRKYRRYEVDLTVVNPALATGYWGQGDNYFSQGTTGNYIDVPSFGEAGYDAYDIEWNDIGGADMNWYAGYNDNFVCLGYLEFSKIGFYSRNSTITNSTKNTIGNYFQSNTIGTNFSGNAIKNDFSNNTLGGNFRFNTIANNFVANTIGDNFQQNTIVDNFINNTTGTNFGANAIGFGFQQNTIGNSFLSNTIANNFNTNVIANNFIRNQIEYSPTATNLTLATHVYGDYTCTIFKNSGGVITLSFVDGTNTVVYTLPTA